MTRALLILLGCSVVVGTEAENHLAPCGDFLQEYERRVDAIAQETTTGTWEFWVTVIPSFAPEWSLVVSNQNERYLVTHVVFDQSLFHSGWVETAPGKWINDPSKSGAHATARTTTISAELHDALRSEWDRSIKSARPSDLIVLDGVMFDFRRTGECARAHSPASETRNGKLVDVVFELARLADGKSDSPVARREKRLLKQLDELPPLID